MVEAPEISIQLLGQLFFYVHTHPPGLGELLSVLWLEQSSAEHAQISTSSPDLFPNSRLGYPAVHPTSPSWLSLSKLKCPKQFRILSSKPVLPVPQVKNLEVTLDLAVLI